MTEQNVTGAGMPKLISIKQLASALSLSERQIRRLNTNQKILAPTRIGGSLRFSEQECIDWLAAGAPDRQTWQTLKLQGGE